MTRLLLLSMAVGMMAATAWAERPFIAFSSSETARPVYRQWTVIKGSETFTLSDFVSSGKLCEWRGYHLWEPVSSSFSTILCLEFINENDQQYFSGFRCSICGRCRKRIKKQEETEDWEN